jgi:hypothetical protein
MTALLAIALRLASDVVTTRVTSAVERVHDAVGAHLYGESWPSRNRRAVQRFEAERRCSEYARAASVTREAS